MSEHTLGHALFPAFGRCQALALLPPTEGRPHRIAGLVPAGYEGRDPGPLLVLWRWDGTVDRVHRLGTSSTPSPGSRLAALPGGGLLSWKGSDGVGRIDPENSALVFQQTDLGPLDHLVVHPEGTHIAVAAGGLLAVLELPADGSEPDELWRCFPSGQPIRALAAAPDGAELVAATADGRLVRFDWSGAERGTLRTGSPQALCYTPDGALLSGAGGGQVLLWGPDGTSRAIGQHSFGPGRGNAGVLAVGCAPDGETLYSVSYARTLQAADRDGRLLWERPAGDDHRPAHCTLVVHPEDGRIAVGNARAHLHLFLPDGSDPLPPAFLHSPRQIDLVGDHLAVFNGRGVQLWDLGSQTRTGSWPESLGCRLRPRPGQPPELLFEDRSYLVGVPADQPDATGRHIARFEGTPRAASPDGALLAWTRDRAVRLTDPDGRTVRWLPHPRQVDALAFSPDGQLLAAASQDEIALWDLRAPPGPAPEAPLWRLEGRFDYPSLAFSPSGQRLALLSGGSSDSTLRVWALSDASARSGPTARENVDALTAAAPLELLLLADGDFKRREYESIVFLDENQLLRRRDGGRVEQVDIDQGSRSVRIEGGVWAGGRWYGLPMARDAAGRRLAVPRTVGDLGLWPLEGAPMAPPSRAEPEDRAPQGETPEDEPLFGQRLAGRVVHISGKFHSIHKSALQARLVALGAKVTKSLTKKTDTLVCALPRYPSYRHEPGKAELKARARGDVEIWYENAALQRIAPTRAECERLLRGQEGGIEAFNQWRLGGGQRPPIGGYLPVHLEGADLRDCDLREAKLDELSLRGADLRGADLRGRWYRVTLTGARLEGARLEGAQISQSLFAQDLSQPDT